jgi:Family of unknown function (DUF6262)
MSNQAKEQRVAVLNTASSRKKQEAQQKTEKAIEKLIQHQEKLSFANIARAAGVSVQYLYKYPELKERIQHLRSQQDTESKATNYQNRSEKSSQAIIQQMKNRVKTLDIERKTQAHEIEILTGRLYELHGVKQLADRLKAENAELKQQLKICIDNQRGLSEINVSQIENSAKNELIESSINQIKSELENLAIKINATLAKLIIEAPPSAVMSAINALKEALVTTKVRNPSGFLVSAIKDSWIPNQNYQEKVKDNTFDEWYELAVSNQLVSAAKKSDGIQYVLDCQGKWVLFENIIIDYPLEKLQ